jgi:hypothetical protein
MEIVWNFIGIRMDFDDPSIEIVWIYYGFRFNCKFHSMDLTFFSQCSSHRASWQGS